MISGCAMKIAIWISLGLAGAGLLGFLVPTRWWKSWFPPESRWQNQASTSGPLLFTGIACLGAMAALLSTTDLLLGGQSRNWRETPALVTAHSVVPETQIRSTSPLWRPQVEYTYQVGGGSYRGETFSFGAGSTTDRDFIEKHLRESFPIGGTITIRVHTADPARSVIQPGSDLCLYIQLGLGLTFLAIGVWQVRALLGDWEGGRL